MSDLLLVNGDFHTMDPRRSARRRRGHPRTDDSLAVGERGGRARGVRGRVRASSTCGAPASLPGLTDAHLHFKWYAESLRAVDVETADAGRGGGARRTRARKSAGRRVDHADRDGITTSGEPARCPTCGRWTGRRRGTPSP